MASKFEIYTDKGGKLRFRPAMPISAVLLSAGMLTACGGYNNRRLLLQPQVGSPR